MAEEKTKKDYVENLKPEMLIAFQFYSNNERKVQSAKVVKKSTKERKLKVVTNYGKEFIINFEDVIWVRTGKRWPRGLYEEMKGVKKFG